MKIQKGVWVSDIHAQHADQQAIAVVTKFLKHFKPDILIFGGDQLDYSSYSMHGKRKNETASEQIDKDHSMMNKILDSMLKHIKPKTLVWLDGNHEVRQDEYFIEFPEMYSREIHRYNALSLRDRGFTNILPYKKPFKLGKLNFVHGWRGGANAVRAHLINDYKTNFVCGHGHRSDTATSSNIDGQIMQGYMSGCLCKRDFKYAQHPTSNHGFIVWYMMPDGRFTLYNIVIVNGMFMFEGKLFKI